MLCDDVLLHKYREIERMLLLKLCTKFTSRNQKLSLKSMSPDPLSVCALYTIHCSTFYLLAPLMQKSI